ncbi:hypothetical protein J3458_003117 [Metarhizium acridum]|uniref:uncharacterized protein n=1 Tax=Metarhizium acridum TaxID=92637 RepID=UPI001C6B3C86|nr:hypothetical protein J3458_003117 [Metarhizium acridum]
MKSPSHRARSSNSILMNMSVLLHAGKIHNLVGNEQLQSGLGESPRHCKYCFQTINSISIHINHGLLLKAEGKWERQMVLYAAEIGLFQGSAATPPRPPWDDWA